MSNPKVGTVTSNVTEAVKTPMAGQAQYRTDKSGIAARHHRPRFCLKWDALRTNLAALVEALVKAKPALPAGVYSEDRSPPQHHGHWRCLRRSAVALRAGFDDLTAAPSAKAVARIVCFG